MKHIIDELFNEYSIYCKEIKHHIGLYNCEPGNEDFKFPHYYIRFCDFNCDGY